MMLYWEGMDRPNSLTWVAGPATPDRVYLTRVWNLGTWDEWRAAHARYPRAALDAVVRHPLKGHWTRHGKAFAEAVCRVVMPDDVRASYHA
jgi:hypothetical protein